MDLHKISKGLSLKFGNELGFEEGKKDLLRFGFETIIGEGLKLLVLFTVGFLYGIFAEMAAVIITIYLFRFVSGGAHNSTYEACFAVTVLSFTALALISSAAADIFSVNFVFGTAIAALLAVFLSIIKWAPAENENRPLKPESRKRLKLLSYLLLGVWAIAIFSIDMFFNATTYSRVAFASSFSLLFQGFTLSPAGFSAIAKSDEVLRVRR